VNRRDILTIGGATIATALAGCSADETDETDDDDDPETEPEPSGNDTETEPEPTGDDNDSELIEFDRYTDLVPDHDELPDDGWEVDQVELEPEDSPRTDITAIYYREVDDGVQNLWIHATGYESIDGAVDRYEESIEYARVSDSVEE